MPRRTRRVAASSAVIRCSRRRRCRRQRAAGDRPCVAAASRVVAPPHGSLVDVSDLFAAVRCGGRRPVRRRLDARLPELGTRMAASWLRRRSSSPRSAALLGWFAVTSRSGARRSPRGLPRPRRPSASAYGGRVARLPPARDGPVSDARDPGPDSRRRRTAAASRSSICTICATGSRARLVVFFRLLLAIPHLIWLSLWTVTAFAAFVVAWVVALVVGRVPPRSTASSPPSCGTRARRSLPLRRRRPVPGFVGA